MGCDKCTKCKCNCKKCTKCECNCEKCNCNCEKSDCKNCTCNKNNNNLTGGGEIMKNNFLDYWGVPVKNKDISLSKAITLLRNYYRKKK